MPLLRTDAPMDGRLFTSTYEHVVVGEAEAPDCRDHPPASDLIAWATVAERSPVVYVQPGDSAATFAHESYRRLVPNALAWVASPGAHQWAAANPEPLRDLTSDHWRAAAAGGRAGYMWRRYSGGTNGCPGPERLVEPVGDRVEGGDVEPSPLCVPRPRCSRDSGPTGSMQACHRTIPSVGE